MLLRKVFTYVIRIHGLKLPELCYLCPVDMRERMHYIMSLSFSLYQVIVSYLLQS